MAESRVSFDDMIEEERAALVAIIQGFMVPSPLYEESEEERIIQEVLRDFKEERNCIPRIEVYVERIVPSFSATEFQAHFRMLPETFAFLITELGPSLRSKGALGGEMISEEKQLLLALWRLATPDSYRSISQRFGVGKATAIRAVRRVTHSLTRLASKYIVWPTGEGVGVTVAGFSRVSGFPRVIGAIDGTHINIPAPKESPEAYVNRKGHHSMHLQAVCDHNGLFTHCYVGNVGSVHDARVFRISAVHGFLSDPGKFPDDSHLVGDAAYMLHPQLMTPYADNGHLTERQKNYNFCQSSARMAIERAFGLLKGRWRCLIDKLAVHLTEEIPFVIMACCVLHNVCAMQRDGLPAVVVGQPQEDQQEVGRAAEGRGLGHIKRNAICAQLRVREI